ncbi:MAG: hypothetical protein LKJ57_06120 [Ancrocorticia sp.]|jgi:predicted amidophosphoribosyltransferase|nr:hypothetical protein [Ancrocorticia sp.]MCI1896085.1 hypothetical protein [Ancrocorticia sp.]MCI1932949.1 hypothetical protein [Ancrocorticia sp.]MCI1963940.1 hypothetical protein [Ancrocorticia sp.]MCI2001624.1 hypothetical protein [Ancrocorticia sp.]
MDETSTERSLLAQWADLLFPRNCAGCGEPDVTLCNSCAREFAGPPREVSGRAPYLQRVLPIFGEERYESLFPVYALAEYAGFVAQAIIRWKNTVDSELNTVMRQLVAQGAARIFEEGMSGPLTIVPAPSRFQRIHDGRFVAGVIAEGVADGARQAGISAVVARPLRSASRYTSAGIVSRRSRASRITARNRVQIGGNILLVDDVLTTGATLVGAARALASCEGKVAGAFVTAVAQDPRAITGISVPKSLPVVYHERYKLQDSGCENTR